jgi:hypothetical protein
MATIGEHVLARKLAAVLINPCDTTEIGGLSRRVTIRIQGTRLLVTSLLMVESWKSEEYLYFASSLQN